jgi:signal transduction histidine kinase
MPPPGTHPWRDRRGRPPWWPEDEPWPPRRRRGPGPFGCLFGLVALVVFVTLVVAVTAVIDALWLGGPARPAQGLLSILVAVLLIVVVVRAIGGGLWRTGRILDRLVDAARQVEDGDYSVRVGPIAGPRGMRELGRAFDTMVDRLDANDRQRRALLADVSHELRTPLAVIRGSVEAIIDGVHPADEAHLGAIVDETRVMERLVEDLRTLALAESGTLTLHREPVDPVELVRDVAASFASVAAEAGVSLEVDAPEAAPTLDLDPVRMREVVANLVDNAIRHTPAGGRVEVRVGATPELRIAVIDTGPGIDPALLPHVFDRFVKGPGSQGSGLGLAIARDLVTAHGGTIEVQSATTGTTFTIRIPAAGPTGTF